MRYRIVVPVFFLLSALTAPTLARADRATIEITGGIGDATRTLVKSGDQIGQEETSLWRVRGQFTVPLSPTLAALLSYTRAGDGSGRLAYIESNGTHVASRERFGLLEIGFRIGL